MTDEQINKAAVQAHIELEETIGLSCVNIFQKGVEWALSHQWISVDERLPKDEKYVFVKLSCGRLPWTAMYDYNLKSWVDVNHVSIHGVTHWMEIPEIGGKE